jgi:hypothetical protein
MRRLKIITDDVPMASGDVLGVNDMYDNLQAYCREQGWDMPQFWVFPHNDVMMCYAVSVHLKGKNQCEMFDANTVFVLKTLSEMGDFDDLENRLSCMLAELGEPIVLTIKSDVNPIQRQFFKGIGLVKMPVTWTDNQQNEYEVYVRELLEMGRFVTLMEKIEHIGIEIVYE